MHFLLHQILLQRTIFLLVLKASYATHEEMVFVVEVIKGGSGH